MSYALRGLVDPNSRALARLAKDGPAPSCDRVWPLSRGGWVARLHEAGGDRDSYWGVIKPDGKLPKPLRRLHDAGRCVWLLELEALAWRLEDDPQVGGATQGTLSPYSSRADLSKWHGLRGQVLGYKPLRRAVARFDDAAGVPKFYAKYLRRGYAARVAEHHSLLESWAEVARGFSVARLTDLRLAPDILVWQPATGTALHQALFRSQHERATTTIDRVGRAIASMHLCPARAARRHSRRKELETLSSWLRVGRELVDDPRQLDSALATLIEVERQLATHDGVLSHRDLHDGQLLVSEESITVLDADTLALAEPELDLGNLLAHLDWNGLKRGERRWRDLAGPLIAAYREVVARPVDRQRLRWYRAASALRLACVHACRPETREPAPDLAGWAAREVGRLDPGERRAI